MRVQDLQLFLNNFTKGSDAVKNAVVFVEINGKLHDIRRMEVQAEALGPSAKKLIYMYPGTQIMELDACGLTLEPLCLGLDACRLRLDALGA
jgi:hypothetical protein